MSQPVPEPSPQPDETGAESSPTPTQDFPILRINVPNVRRLSLSPDQQANIANHVLQSLTSAQEAAQDPNCVLVATEIVACTHPDGSLGECRIDYYECEDGTSFTKTTYL